MQLKTSVKLEQYSTMRLGGTASYVADIKNKEDILEALDWATKQNVCSVIMIGTGSNIVWRDEGFNGLLLVNKMMGYQVTDDNEEGFTVRVGAGENWDSVVGRVVKLGGSGVEGLSLIPGTAGATPIQNVGAYGQEISHTLVSVEAYDRSAERFVVIDNKDCNFGYRTSRFKTTDKDRFFIVSITLRLAKTDPKPPFYESLNEYFKDRDVTHYTVQGVRDAVIAIRSAKLPDPTKVANNGSFFANPIIPEGEFSELITHYPHIKSWSMRGGQTKVSAAWLIEHAGFKNFHDKETGIGTWPGQALILINENASRTADLLNFKNKITNTVKIKYKINLQQEPELLP